MIIIQQYFDEKENVYKVLVTENNGGELINIKNKLSKFFSTQGDYLVIGGSISNSGCFYLDGASKVKKKLINYYDINPDNIVIIPDQKF